MVVLSVPAALAAAGEGECDGEAFLIGGAQLYATALPLADRLQLTEIDASFAGDTWFPTIDPGLWHEVARQAQRGDEGFDYAFVTYERN